MKAKTTHPPRYAHAIKAKAVARLDAGERAEDIARSIGCTDSVIYLWRKQARQRGADHPATASSKANGSDATAIRDAIALLKHAQTEMSRECAGRIDRLTRSNKLTLLALDTLTAR